MRVVVVGATGNVGTAVLRALAARPDLGVDAVARRPPDPVPPYDRAAWTAVDVGAEDAAERLTRLFTGADAVVHLAWLLQPNHDEAVMRRTNVGGLAATLQAVARAGVPHVVVASSIGAYRAGPKRRVDESWPADAIPTSQYGRQKGEDEAMLDAFAAGHPGVAVARLRPGLVMHAAAGRELARLFLGPLVPTRLLAPLRVPLVPVPSRFVSQVIDADDLADAVLRILDRRAAGPFNLAAEPVVGPRQLAAALHGRWLPVPLPIVRALAAATWRLRLQRTDPGWVDLAAGMPLMSTARARHELDWSPSVDSITALRRGIGAVGRGTSLPGSPPLG